ncbi:MAG: flavohemoglobin expression-modulating QEGLA motif protein [Polyangiaceae bacterium]
MFELPRPNLIGLRPFEDALAALSERVIDAQRPIRILNALRWSGRVEEQFARARGRELPRPEYDPDLGFDRDAKRAEFDQILRDIHRELGRSDPLARMLRDTAEEYRRSVDLLDARGTPRFYEISRELYGSTRDLLPDGRTTVREMGERLGATLGAIAWNKIGEPQPREFDATQAAEILNVRFASFFGESMGVRVDVDDTLVADAAAGSDYVKIRSGARFSRSDIDILEAHEGWVHLATSLNGQAQPVARWLAKGPPRTVAVQEGLAVLVETLTLRSTPRRAKKLNDRVRAVEMAESGADFLDIYEWYRTAGYEEDECFQNSMRVFRGGTTVGGAPFTKDASYCTGIVLNQAFMHAALTHDRPELIPFLFVGKVAHEDVPHLHARVADGLVRPPPFLPAIFREMHALAVWLCHASFFATLQAGDIVEHYAESMRRG